MRKLIILRRFSQAFFLALFVYILWSTTYPLKGVLPPGTFFRINPLIMIITSISERVLLPGLLASSAMLLLTLLLGRFFCGWVCPLGSTIDVAGVLNRRVDPASEILNNIIRKVKFLILGTVGLATIFELEAAWPFDPMVIMARFVSLNLIPTITSLINGLFVFLIRDLGLYGPVQGMYRALKPTLLGVKVYYFAHAAIIFLFFAFICASAFAMRRFWCRALCPLGALYALFARFAPLRRIVKNCIQCKICKSTCRMGAIKDDASYVQGECILCMDCVYDCPENATRFRWSPFKAKEEVQAKPTAGGSGMSRRDFLLFAFSLPFLFGFVFKGRREKPLPDVIRPPAALKEEEFLNRCIRCGNCMKACITNGLQPTLLEAGYEGIWTPRLVPEIGYCEYQCTLCGEACPTGAIPPLTVEKKRLVRLGIAEIDRSICLPWAYGKDCIVCQEHCPVPDKAIKLQKDRGILKPSIDEGLCIGCGICQYKCPVRPTRAVRVSPRLSART